MNLYQIETAMPTKISKLLSNLWFWRILGFGSSIALFTCFALSPSFDDLFGRWNLFKGAIYSVISLSVITMMLFIENCRTLTRSVLVKPHVNFLVMMITSLCSIWQDLVSQKLNDESGSSGRILNICSFGAFVLMSLSLSRQLELGFEVGISNCLIGSFLVLLMKMDFKLAPLAAILCYGLVHIRSFSNFRREMRGCIHSSHTVPENIESGNHSIDLQRMSKIEFNLSAFRFPSYSSLPDSIHKNRLQEYAQKSHIPLPIYQAVKIGLEHAPKYRSAVSVDGKTFTSENLFPNRGLSEQDAAKLAFKHITTGVKDEGLSLILEGPTSFTSILKDYAKKINQKCRYNTVPQEGLADFKSSLDFNGKRYIGDPKKTKKEAEQSASCAAVLSNLESILL